MVPSVSRAQNDPLDLSIQQIYNSGVDETGSIAPQDYYNGMTSNLSPTGMHLGEFMLEGDIEFINQLAGMGQLMSMERNLGNGGNLNHQQDMQHVGHRA